MLSRGRAAAPGLALWVRAGADVSENLNESNV
jgi:hypothetical protein